jgi:hypothetical protein
MLGDSRYFGEMRTLERHPGSGLQGTARAMPTRVTDAQHVHDLV